MMRFIIDEAKKQELNVAAAVVAGTSSPFLVFVQAGLMTLTRFILSCR